MPWLQVSSSIRPSVPKQSQSTKAENSKQKHEGSKMEFTIQNKNKKKPKFLCLHGFRTSAAILKKQVGRLPEIVLDRLDLHFLNGPILATGKSDLEGIFDPPYYQWFSCNQVRVVQTYQLFQLLVIFKYPLHIIGRFGRTIMYFSTFAIEHCVLSSTFFFFFFKLVFPIVLRRTN